MYYSKDMDNDTAAVSVNDFPIRFVSALLDSGSSITLMSKQLYEFLPSNVKYTLSPLHWDKIILTNKQDIYICGLSQRTSDSGNGNHSVSLPIILIKIKSMLQS